MLPLVGQAPAVTSESEQLPFPPIQTLSLWSIAMPWLESGQVYPSRRAAPGVDQVAVRIELQNGRRGGATFAGRGLGVEPGLVSGVERREAAVDDEDVILRIDPHPDG